MLRDEFIAAVGRHRTWPLYILHGEEQYGSCELRDMVIDSLIAPQDREMGLTVFNRDPALPELMAVIESAPFFAASNVVVINGTALFRAGQGKNGAEETACWEKLFNSIPAYSQLIFCCDGRADKRKKLFRLAEQCGVVVESAALRLKNVRPWLNAEIAARKLRFDSAAMEYLLEVLNLMPRISRGFLHSELDKLQLCGQADSSGKVTKQLLQEMLSALPEVSAFALVDAMTAKDTALALSLFTEQLASGVYPLQIIGLIARQVRSLMIAKAYSARLTPKQVAQKLGVPSFIGEKLVRQSRAFTAQTLERTLLALADANRDFKTNAAPVLLEDIIIDFCQG